MSKLNSKIFKLARLLKFYQETKLNDGTTISHEGDLAINSEVFIEDENGDIVPLADGEYLTEDNTKLMVEGGKVMAIVAEEAPLETTEDVKEEQPQNDNVEHNEAEHEEMSEQPAEHTEPTEPEGRIVGEDGELANQEPAENSENTENSEDERDARIAELETANAELTSQLEAANARIAELEALVNDYKEKESKSVDDNVDDAFKSQENKKVVSNFEYVRSRVK